jgi:hypothetical protein
MRYIKSKVTGSYDIRLPRIFVGSSVRLSKEHYTIEDYLIDLFEHLGVSDVKVDVRTVSVNYQQKYVDVSLNSIKPLIPKWWYNFHGSGTGQYTNRNTIYKGKESIYPKSYRFYFEDFDRKIREKYIKLAHHHLIYGNTYLFVVNFFKWVETDSISLNPYVKNPFIKVEMEDFEFPRIFSGSSIKSRKAYYGNILGMFNRADFILQKYHTHDYNKLWNVIKSYKG